MPMLLLLKAGLQVSVSLNCGRPLFTVSMSPHVTVAMGSLKSFFIEMLENVS